MSTNPPAPPNPDELTDEEEARIDKYLSKVLPDKLKQHAPPTPPAPSPTPPAPSPTPASTSAPSVDVNAAVQRALDERDKQGKMTQELAELRDEVAKLKKRSKKWYDPFSLFG